MLLRLAVVLNRARSDDVLSGVAALAQGEALAVAFSRRGGSTRIRSRVPISNRSRRTLAAAGIGLRFA